MDHEVARENIRQLKARYFRLVDFKQWDEWGDLFTATAELKVESLRLGGAFIASPKIVGRSAIIAHVRSNMERTESFHQGGMPEIEIVSGNFARAIWSMSAIVDYTKTTSYSCGYYHETYAFEDGVWRIATLLLKLLKVISVARGTHPSKPL
jgi:hypothetical protein